MFVTYWGSPPGVKRPERKVNHSPPSTAQAKNEWSRTSLSYMTSWRGEVKVYVCLYPTGCNSLAILQGALLK